MADSIKTPLHLVPEWYFLPFYAVLRSIPHKVGGILAMGASIGVLFLLPSFHQGRIRSGSFQPLHQFVFFWTVILFLLLGWEGQETLDDISKYVGPFLLIAYFVVVLLGFGLSSYLQNQLLHKNLT